MTLSELHSRILLHELRTILLDETREGGQIPQRWRELLQSDPHTPANSLVLADWLDDQGDPLGELCRIQVELIGILPVNWMITQTQTDPNLHPFAYEAPANGTYPTPPGKLTRRRWEITKSLYPSGRSYQFRDEDGEITRTGIELTHRKLGRTTRMLTDTLRYCALNQGKHVLVQLPGDDVEQSKKELQFDRLCRELLDREPAWLETHTAHIPDCQIHFGQPGMNHLVRTRNTPAFSSMDNLSPETQRVARTTINAHLINAGVFRPDHPIQTEYDIVEQCWLSTQFFPPDITFTDHACQPQSLYDFTAEMPIPLSRRPSFKMTDFR